MTKKINVAIIGLGVGLKHIQAYLTCKDINSIGIYDFDKKKIKMIIKDYPFLKVYKNENEIFKDKSIEIVSIASYDNYHYKQILKCFEYKKNFIVEKPLCENAKQLKKIISLSKKYPDIKFTSNLPLRTEDIFIFFKKKIKSLNPYYIEADYLWGRSYKLFEWRSKLKSYSIINGAAVHVIDLVLWLLDKTPTHVKTISNKISTKNSKFKKNSFSLILLYFKNGLVVKLTANATSLTPHFHAVKIFDKKLTLINEISSRYMIKKNNVIKKLNYFKYPIKKNRKKIITSFVGNVLSNNRLSLVSKDYSLFLTKICLAAIKSEKTNLIVKI